MTFEQAIDILKFGGVGYTQEQTNEALGTIYKEHKALELIKTKSCDNANFALVKDSHTYELYNEQFDFFLKDYEERGGGFSWYERNRFTQEEYDLLRGIFVNEN